ncbi:hypothetical protein LPB19_15030 [Marinobacter salinisoli]|uniref:Uncharacterized protein n=1 Tax=Marinobacter salinisoli TaxID=2769486 RepID=A0ABX7MW57_9GAMM|nr:hypothetical protein [Marinobacter salinisoli]QSP94473.1 hypothetical protein LPB19_15030 [Marinobacter salinisoli]
MTVDRNECVFLTRSGLKRLEATGVLESIPTDSCYTEDFIDRLNDHDFSGMSDYSNEIFFYHYVRLLEFSEVLKSSACSRFSLFARVLDKNLFIRAKAEAGKQVSLIIRMLTTLLSFFVFIFSVISIVLLSFLLPFYLVRRKESDITLEFDVNRKVVFLIRSKAAYQKCRLSIEREISAVTLVDNFGGLNVPGVSIYSVVCWKNIFKISLMSAFHALRDIKNILKDGRVMLGRSCALALFPGYLKRIAHKAVYESCLDEVVRLSPRAVFYTGDKDDRFALLQTKVCHREKKELVCLPHGLEYGFRFPGGLAGTTFYCFTPEAASFLNRLYHEDKFLYVGSVVDSMYGVGGESKFAKLVERVCFFTEPRNPEVNYRIIEELTGRNVSVSIKLHPLETASNYKNRFPNVEQIEDLDEAMRSSVCIARKSTVLLESSRRGVKAIAALVNDKDRAYVMKIFPSLCSENIFKAFTFDELQELL